MRSDDQMPPDLRDIPIIDLPHAALVQAYQRCASTAVDFQRAGAELLRTITAAAEALDDGDAARARQLLYGPILAVQQVRREH